MHVELLGNTAKCGGTSVHEEACERGLNRAQCSHFAAGFAQFCPWWLSGQGVCATMARGVPKDCTNRSATLPKRLGKFFYRFFFAVNALKTLIFHEDVFLPRISAKKVGMGIALGLSALLT
jgi:hypothetical protein